MIDDTNVADPSVMPHSTEAEAALLGSMLLDSTAASLIVDSAAFYTPFHASVYRAIHRVASAGHAVDLVTVHEAMSTAGAVPADAMSRLNELAQFVPTGASARRYAAIVGEYHQRRQLMRAGHEIARIAASITAPAEQLDRAQSLLVKLGTTKNQRDPRSIIDSMPGYLQLLDDLSQGRNPAMSTGLVGLDKLLNGGLRRGEMLVLGARPKHGKTALALALARYMSSSYSVLYLSQEMPITQLMHRHVAAAGCIDLGRILRADPEDREMWAAVGEAAEALGQLKLLHDDQSALSMLDIRRKAMKVRRAHGLDVLMVDFLQLMAGGDGENRNRELDVIANGLKALAMELGIVVITLSQMSRKADEALGRPTMTHLRDSGAIEAAADQIALIYTDHAHPLSKREPAFAGHMALEIVAHRNGPQGLIHLQFNGAQQRITDWPGSPPKRESATASRAAPRGMPTFSPARTGDD